MDKLKDPNELELYKINGNFYNEDSINLASYYGRIDILNWWLNSGLELKYNEKALYYATKKERLDVLKWWSNSGLKLIYDVETICIAFNKDIYEWWRQLLTKKLKNI